jgi:hypothetical protein
MPDRSFEGVSCRVVRRELSGSFRSPRFVAVVWLSACLGVASSASDELIAADWFVDSGGGLDTGERGRTSSLPFLTIGYAISRIEEAEDVRPYVHLARGLYEGDRHGGPGIEHLPLRVPANVVSFDIVGPAAASDELAAMIVSLDESSTIFLAEMPSVDVGVRNPGFDLLRFANLRLQGGKVGITVVPPTNLPALRSPGTVLIENSVFRDIQGNAMQIFSSNRWALDATVKNSTVERCGGGVAMHVATGGTLTGEISTCEFSDLPSVLPGYLVGGAIDLHADSGATLEVLCERNRIRNPHIAFSLTTSNGPGLTTFDATIRNNLIYNEPNSMCGEGFDSERCGLQAGFLLSLWPRHNISVDVVNNTFYDIRTWPFFVENYAAIAELPGDQLLPVHVLNNIFWQRDEDGRRPTPLWNGPEPGVFAGATFEHNTAPPYYDLDGLPASTNSSVAPQLLDVEERDFSLARGSSAIDSGSDVFAPELHGRLDLVGRCRIARPENSENLVVDRGAFEFPGVCRVGGPTAFARGDCNDDGLLDLADSSYSFGYLFLGFEGPPNCMDACDSNDDGIFDIADPIYGLNFLFLGAAAPPAPYPDAGEDPTQEDVLPACRSTLQEQ